MPLMATARLKATKTWSCVTLSCENIDFCLLSDIKKGFLKKCHLIEFVSMNFHPYNLGENIYLIHPKSILSLLILKIQLSHDN